MVCAHHRWLLINVQRLVVVLVDLLMVLDLVLHHLVDQRCGRSDQINVSKATFLVCKLHLFVGLIL